MRDHVSSAPERAEYLFCWCIKSHCLYMPCTGVSDVTNKGYIRVRVKCHLLVEVFASRLFEQKKVCLITWLFSSEALKGVQSLNCSCKFIFVDFYSSDVILILWSDFKMTLITWFNFDPGRKHFSMGHKWLPLKQICCTSVLLYNGQSVYGPLSGHPVFVAVYEHQTSPVFTFYLHHS